MELIDSHCHLTFPDISDDIDDVFSRAESAGVSHFLTICTKTSEISPLLNFVRHRPRVFASVGVHPHEAEKEDLSQLMETLKAAIVDPKVIALGETGLDYFYEHSPRGLQKESFSLHCQLSLETGLPLIVHTREADEDTLAVLRSFPNVQGVFHCFSGDLALSRAALDLGFYISISGIVSFKKAESLRDVVRMVPLDRLLVETDAPYLAPVPHRGKRNEPAFMVETVQCIADLHNLLPEDIATQTTSNFKKLFSGRLGVSSFLS